MKSANSLARIGRASLAVACAAGFGAIGLTSTAAAADLQEITVAAPAVKVVQRGPGTSTTQQITVSARVQYDPVTLTTNSGVALLKDGVEDAARRICRAADPGAPEDTNCIRNATGAAQAQIDAAVARARAQAH